MTESRSDGRAHGSSSTQPHRGSGSRGIGDDVEDEEMPIGVDSSQEPKHGRGYTLLEDIWNLPKFGKKIDVQFNNLGQPIGDEGGKYTKFMGTAVRKSNLGPLNYKTWKKFPAIKKEHLWIEMKKRFTIPPEREHIIRYWTIKTFGQKWRAFKSDLRRRHFVPDAMTKEEMAALVPPRVNKDQWESVINHWCSMESLRMSETNKVNREKQRMIHTTGTKSFARVAAEMAKADGVAPSRGKLFIKTHTRKDGSYITNDVQERIGLLQNKMIENPNNALSINDDIGWSNNDVYTEVFGSDRHGRVRGVGNGPTPSQKTLQIVPRQLRGLAMADVGANNRDEEVEQLKLQMTNMLAQFNVQLMGLQSQLSTIMSHMQSFGRASREVQSEASTNRHVSNIPEPHPRSPTPSH